MNRFLFIVALILGVSLPPLAMSAESANTGSTDHWLSDISNVLRAGLMGLALLGLVASMMISGLRWNRLTYRFIPIFYGLIAGSASMIIGPWGTKNNYPIAVFYTISGVVFWVFAWAEQYGARKHEKAIEQHYGYKKDEEDEGSNEASLSIIIRHLSARKRNTEKHQKDIWIITLIYALWALFVHCSAGNPSKDTTLVFLLLFMTCAVLSYLPDKMKQNIKISSESLEACGIPLAVCAESECRVKKMLRNMNIIRSLHLGGIVFIYIIAEITGGIDAFDSLLREVFDNVGSIIPLFLSLVFYMTRWQTEKLGREMSWLEHRLEENNPWILRAENAGISKHDLEFIGALGIIIPMTAFFAYPVLLGCYFFPALEMNARNALFLTLYTYAISLVQILALTPEIEILGKKFSLVQERRQHSISQPSLR
ncbi:MAG: hypothetical protein LBB76_07155 [Azoarcus sp.]|nr:hypothetical protein [Azoarcus sp.]